MNGVSVFVADATPSAYNTDNDAVGVRRDGSEEYPVIVTFGDVTVFLTLASAREIAAKLAEAAR
jgi:hypothetical protein